MERAKHWREIDEDTFEAYGWELLVTAIDDWIDHAPDESFDVYFPEMHSIMPSRVYRFNAELSWIEEMK